MAVNPTPRPPPPCSVAGKRELLLLTSERREVLSSGECRDFTVRMTLWLLRIQLDPLILR